MDVEEYACRCFTLAEPCQSIRCFLRWFICAQMTEAFSYNAVKKVSNFKLVSEYHISLIRFRGYYLFHCLLFCGHYSRAVSIRRNTVVSFPDSCPQLSLVWVETGSD